MAGRTGRQRVMLLFAVLAGLFLMHGLSAPSMHCMPMQMPTSTAMPITAPVSAPAESVMPPEAQIPSALNASDGTSDHTQADSTCVPLRPEGMAALFLALFLLVTAPWRPGLPFLALLIHPRWPHGPPRTGAQVLRTLSISRT